MSVRRLDPVQPESFAFSPENLDWAKAQIGKYPEGKQASAVIALLWRAQAQHAGWLPEPAIRYVADMLGMAHVRVLEVATFYTMFQLSPVGTKAHIQVCGTTPCMLRGAEDLINVCKSRIAASAHKLSDDGAFSWEEVECIGACVNAPLIQVGTDLYEDLTPASLGDVLDAFARGEHPKPGPRIDRQHSAPIGGATTLTTPGLYDARGVAGHGAAAAVANDAMARDLDAATSGAAAAAATTAADLASGVKVTGDAGSPRDDAAKPAALAGARDGKADDLKLISGVGPKLEGVLNGLGIYHFDQIAAWTPATVAWVDDFLSFKGRIDRDGWIAQAKKLAGE